MSDVLLFLWINPTYATPPLTWTIPTLRRNRNIWWKAPEFWDFWESTYTLKTTPFIFCIMDTNTFVRCKVDPSHIILSHRYAKHLHYCLKQTIRKFRNCPYTATRVIFQDDPASIECTGFCREIMKNDLAREARLRN